MAIGSLMTSTEPSILVVNGGSSSIRFAVYRDGGSLRPVLRGLVERIGMPGTALTFTTLSPTTLSLTKSSHGEQHQVAFAAVDHRSAAILLLDWLESQPCFAAVTAVGHRIVHGMAHAKPEKVTKRLVEELHLLCPLDPGHLPQEIDVIEAFQARHPDLTQVACFDTAFHHAMPRVASMLPIPRHYQDKGIRRYGFHGLSYAYLIEELARVAGNDAAHGRVILAHLGNGASLAAVQNGHSIDTSMGFTPTAGMPMGTRSGDVDPGLAPYLQRTEQMSTECFFHMVNLESGLRGISETSSDMRDLLAVEATDIRAAEAIAFFCYQAKKYVGAYAAALGGLETIVFTGGIGEHAAPIRARICAGLEFLGIHLDATRNAAHAPVISTDASRVAVRVISTDEELMIARSVCRLLNIPITNSDRIP